MLNLYFSYIFCFVCSLYLSPLLQATQPDSAFLLDGHWQPDINQWKISKEEERILKKLGIAEVNRPNNCPIATRKPLSLASRLQAIAQGLMTGPCKGHHTELVASMNEAAKTLEVQSGRLRDDKAPESMIVTPNSAGEMQTTSTPARTTNSSNMYMASIAASGSNIVSGMAQLPLDQACMNHLKERGLLPALTQITTGIGQMALFVPSPTGLMVGAGGLALGATLNLLKQLLGSRFNWSSAQDRKQFLDLNCAFFDARRELDARKYFKLNDKSWSALLQQTHGLRDSLAQKINRFNAQVNRINQNISQKKNLHHTSCLRQELIQARGAINSLFVIINRETVDKKTKGEFIDFFMKVDQKILLDAFSVMLQDKRKTFIFNLLNEIFVSSGESLFRLNDDQFYKNYFEPISFYSIELKQFLDQKDKECYDSFGRLAALTEHSPSNFAVEKSINDEIMKTSSYLIELHESVMARAALLQSYEKLDDLDPFSEGAQQQFDLIQEYNTNMEIIYGTVGWSFLKYLLKEMKYSYNDFKKQYKKWNPGLPIAWACRDAEQIMKTWDYLNSSLELSYNFFDTNKGFMSHMIPQFKWFLGFIPTGHSRKYKLNRNLKSAEMARVIISRNSKFTDKDYKLLRKFRGWPHLNLGVFALNIKNAKKIRAELQGFYETNSCGSFA